MLITPNDLPFLKAILSVVAARDCVVRVYDPSDVVDSHLVEYVRRSGVQAMSLGDNEYAFCRENADDTNNSESYTLLGFDASSNPGYAVLIEDGKDYSPALIHLVSFFDWLYADEDFDLSRQPFNVAELLKDPEQNGLSADVTETFNDLKNALSDNYSVEQFARDVEGDRDLYEVHHYLHRVGFDFRHLAHWLDLEFIEITHEVTTEAFGLEIPSAEILETSHEFKNIANRFADIWKPTNQIKIPTKTSLGVANVLVTPYDLPNAGVGTVYCGFFITLGDVVFRLYSGTKMADHANQPGITLSKRLDSDAKWDYDNQVRVTCFNVSPSRAIAALMEESFPTRSDLATTFGIALFNVIHELGLNYGEELTSSGLLQVGELDYEDYARRFNANKS